MANSDTHTTASNVSMPSIGRDAVLRGVVDVDRMARRLADARAVPGVSIAIVHGDDTVHVDGYGLRHVDDERARVDGDTVFQLASLSKPLAATVVAALVGDGTVRWDTRCAARSGSSTTTPTTSA